MEKIINGSNIRKFAYVNDAVCVLPIKGIVLDFFGLNDVSMFDRDTENGAFYGEKGILYVVPYSDPWAWMNTQTVELVDELIDVLIGKLWLDGDIPIVSSGGSMGGQSALVYCVYAKRTPVACVANCPVCDVVYHYTERDDLPRTLYSALHNASGSLDDALRSISPLHLIGKLPKINYRIFHCTADRAVNIAKHSDVFVQEMRRAGYTVGYDTVSDRGHCDIGPEMKKLYARYIVDAVEK